MSQFLRRPAWARRAARKNAPQIARGRGEAAWIADCTIKRGRERFTMTEGLCRRGDWGHEGFSLIEALVATAIVSTALVSVIQVVLLATSANRLALRLTVATALATQKIEQLVSLAWLVDANGAPVTDTSTDLSVSPELPAGGNGLSPSPAAALAADAAGCVDYLDAAGAWIGTGASPPRGTMFVRRWSITPLVGHPDQTLLLQVLVTKPAPAPASPTSPPTLGPGDVMLATLRSRRAQ